MIEVPILAVGADVALLGWAGGPVGAKVVNSDWTVPD